MRVSWSNGILGTGLLLVLACSASGEQQSLLPEPAAPAPGTLPDNPMPGVGGQGAPSTGTGNPGFDLGASIGEEIEPMGCQQAEREFVPKIPTVFLLVDRSGTMFYEVSTGVTPWSALRGGVLEVMRELQASVRFGFGAFSGKDLGQQMCDLQVPLVPPALDNYSAIAATYEPLGQPIDSKDTPTVLALRAAAQQLLSDPIEGDKYILFVTDGEPDYCGDGNSLCPPDSVVGLLQNLAAGVGALGAPQPPIQTLVFGVTSPQATILPSALQGFANAGAGLPVAPLLQNPNQPYDPNALFDQCYGIPGWKTDFDATGKQPIRGQTIGVYATDPTLAGTATVYRPDPNDQAALTEQIRAALAGVKSCTFDLGEDGVQVDLTRQDLGEKARVVVNGNPVSFDAANGWSMLSETTVALAGQACNDWRSPTIVTSIRFDFPCDIFIPR